MTPEQVAQYIDVARDKGVQQMSVAIEGCTLTVVLGAQQGPQLSAEERAAEERRVRFAASKTGSPVNLLQARGKA